MNVNIKVSLTDDERRVMLFNMTGIDRKRRVSRAEVNEFVTGAVAGMLVEVPVQEELKVEPVKRPLYDLSLVPSKYDNKSEQWRIGWFRGRYVIKAFTI